MKQFITNVNSYPLNGINPLNHVKNIMDLSHRVSVKQCSNLINAVKH